MPLKPLAKSTLLNRAIQAKENNDAASAHLRDAMVTAEQERAVEITQEKLQTATDRDDWEVITSIPQARMALQLEIAPLVKLVMPKGGSDLLLVVGQDSSQWPTVRSLVHLGDLIQTHGLA